jgi:hypothetical protein
MLERLIRRLTAAGSPGILFEVVGIKQLLGSQRHFRLAKYIIGGRFKFEQESTERTENLCSLRCLLFCSVAVSLRETSATAFNDAMLGTSRGA